VNQQIAVDERSPSDGGRRLARGFEAAARKAGKVAVLPAGIISRRRRGDLTILLYHRVGPGTSQIDVGSRAFDRQLEQIAERDRSLRLDEALDPATNGEGGIVITFDDGLRDFHDRVVPALVERRLPAVLYLATGLVHGEGTAHVPDRDRLTWSHLLECVQTGLVTIGSHTHSHADLGRASEREAAEEMQRSKDLIEDRLGVACRDFAYPWAVASPGAELAARRIFASAALDAWHTNRRGRVDPHRLGRTPVLRADGPLFFAAKRVGALDAEALLYRALRRGPWGRGS
jgi:peptidoglycan/xylan/chitin deacetylase (PgdA/CDA1 family)